MAINKNLIFDIGLHKGLDANFYLRKGFKVIGLEAVPDLCAKATELNREYIDDGRLIIVEKALYYKTGETVKFYVNPEKDDWGSLFQHGAEKGVGKSKEISVKTITLHDMMAEYGTPYFIKCDIEGGDAIFCEQLLSLKERPDFVSVEATSLDDLAFMRASGYDRFQIVNQYHNAWKKPPNPPLEGKFVDTTFSHEMSGAFGKELNPKKWVTFADALRLFNDWHDLNHRDSELAIGWLDVHASTAATLGHRA